MKKCYTAFTKEQGTKIWDAAKKVTGGEYKAPVRNFHSTYPTVVYNAHEDEAVPGYGCMAVTGVKVLGERVFIEVNKPTSEHGEFLINGAEPIQPKTLGSVPLSSDVRKFLSTDYSQAADPYPSGIGYGPRANEWGLERGGTLITGWGKEDQEAPFKNICVGTMNHKGNMLLYTPTDGIPARTGQVIPFGFCTPYRIEYSSNANRYSEILNNANSSQTMQVFNTFSSAIAGNVFIHAMVIDGHLTVTSEDCA